MAREYHDDTPWLSFSDVVTALLFVFIATTFWFMLRLEEARRRADQEFEQWRGADRQAGILLAEVAGCLEKESGELHVRPVVDARSRTLSVYIEPVAINRTIVEWFPGCSAALSPSTDDVVGRVRGCLADEIPQLKGQYSVQLTLEGHTDARNTDGCAALFPSNWELSGSRAGAVLRRLLCEDGSCQRPESVQQAETLKALTTDQRDLQIIAAGRAASRPALHALCAEQWRGAEVDADLDREICAMVQERAQPEADTAAINAKILSRLQGALGGFAGPLPSVDAALVAWANDPRCMGSDKDACRDRLGRMRRVDMRVDLRPRR